MLIMIGRSIALYFKLMKSEKEVTGIVSIISQMILQTRISPQAKHLHRIASVQSQLEVLKSHMNPSDEFLYFLIDKESYQIRPKIISHQRKNPQSSLVIVTRFTIFDKDSSITQTAQQWKMKLHRKEVTSLQPSDSLKELIHLIGKVTQQLTSTYNFSELTRNKEACKKYVIDFKVQVGGDQKDFLGEIGTEYRVKNWNAKVNDRFQLMVSCYWREKINLQFFKNSSYAGNHYRKPRKASQQTRVDSCCSRTSKESTVKKCRSIQQKEEAIQIYDSQLGLTILSSSDSDSFSHSRNFIEEMDKEDGDDFELLIEDDTNDDALFVIENQLNFENWQKCVNLNFH